MAIIVGIVLLGICIHYSIEDFNEYLAIPLGVRLKSLGACILLMIGFLGTLFSICIERSKKLRRLVMAIMIIVLIIAIPLYIGAVQEVGEYATIELEDTLVAILGFVGAYTIWLSASSIVKIRKKEKSLLEKSSSNES